MVSFIACFLDQERLVCLPSNQLHREGRAGFRQSIDGILYSNQTRSDSSGEARLQQEAESNWEQLRVTNRGGIYLSKEQHFSTIFLKPL